MIDLAAATNVLMPDTASMVTSAAIGGAILGVSYLIKNSIRYSGAPPGPRRVPIVGNVEFNPTDGTAFNRALQELSKKYGPILCMYIGNRPFIVINDYKMLKEAFVTKGTELAGRPDDEMIATYNPGYPNIRGIIDASYSDEWKAQRNTALTILRGLGWGKSSIERKILAESEALVEELEKMQGEPFHPASLIGTAVTNIICSLLFEQRFHYKDKEIQELLKSIDDLLTGFGETSGGHLIPFMKYNSGYRKARALTFRSGAKLVDFYRKKIEEARRKLAAGEELTDFVSTYLKEIQSSREGNSRIKEDWTIQHISDFFLAGAETTSTTLVWSFVHLANNQDIQERAYREISSKFDQKHTITLEDRDKLPYCCATLMELQRISAIVSIALPHEAMRDTTIAGYKIPKGTEIWGNLHAILKDPEVFPEPDKFKPERFLNETQDSLQRHEQWIPFSIGRRTCLGEQLARQELFLFFTALIRAFSIQPPEGVARIEYQEVFKTVLKPTPYKVRFVPRS